METDYSTLGLCPFALVSCFGCVISKGTIRLLRVDFRSFVVLCNIYLHTILHPQATLATYDTYI